MHELQQKSDVQCRCYHVTSACSWFTLDNNRNLQTGLLMTRRSVHVSSLPVAPVLTSTLLKVSYERHLKQT